MPGGQQQDVGDPGKRLTVDHELQRELTVCDRYKIPHSHFLGGPAVWTADDREKALEYVRWQGGFCDGCGTREEWWDPEQGGDRFAFVVETRRCPGCELKEQEREQIPNSAKGIHMHLIPNVPDNLED